MMSPVPYRFHQLSCRHHKHALVSRRVLPPSQSAPAASLLSVYSPSVPYSSSTASVSPNHSTPDHSLSAAGITFPCWRPSPELLDAVRSVPGVSSSLEDWHEERIDALLEHTNVRRVQMPYGNYAYVYGSHHVGSSTMSKRFVALARAVRPDILVLEMCSERLPTGARKVNLENASEQGGDMITAVAAAGEVGAQVCLGDRPMSITESRIGRSATIQDKIRMRFHQEDHHILNKPSTGGAVYRILTHERNCILATALMSAAKQAASQGKDVVGIVGQSHLSGIINKLETDGEKLLSGDLNSFYQKEKVEVKKDSRSFVQKYLFYVLLAALLFSVLLSLQFVQ